MLRGKLVFGISLLVALSACSKSGSGSGDGDGEGSIPGDLSGGPLTDINFDFDSSALSSSAQGVLRTNASWIKENNPANVVVEGHCDERGTIEYNLALGERRARSAKDFLRSLGVTADKLDIVSYGEELPLDQGHSESAWAKNRRAHFSVKQ